MQNASNQDQHVSFDQVSTSTMCMLEVKDGRMKVSLKTPYHNVQEMKEI